jgi:gliding motility-associated-like protein
MKNSLLLFLSLTLSIISYGQPGSSCADAITLYPSDDCGNNSGAQFAGHYSSLWGNQDPIDNSGYGNVEGIDGSCAGDDTAQDVIWVKVCATTTSFTIENDGASGPNPPARDYSIFTGGCGSLTEYACYTLAGGASQLVTGLTTGDCYYIMISAADGGTSTQQRICVTSTVPFVPPNDDCASATTLTTDGTLTTTNASATEQGPICSGSVENNTWYQWCAPASWPVGQQAYINLNNQICNWSLGLQLTVWDTDASCPTSSLDPDIICDNPGNQTDYYYQWTAVANTCYYITVDGYAGQACTFDLTVGSIIVSACAPNGGSIGSNETICDGGDPAALTDITSPFNGDGTWTYGWQMDVGCTGTWTTIGGETGLTYDPPVSTQTTCYRRVASNSCNGGTPVYSNSVTITVSPDPTPDAGSNVDVCNGSSVTIGADPIYAVDASDYSWDNGGGAGTLDLLGGTDNGQATVSPVVNTTYTVTLTDPLGCVGTSSVNVTVIAPPVAGTNGLLDICTNDVPTDLINELGGSPQAGGAWTGPSSLTNGDQGTFDPSTMSGGVYTYTVTGTAPCADAIATVTVNLTTGPNAGTNGSASFCPSDPLSDLFDELGSASSGGAWTGPEVLANGDQGTFDPSSQVGGTYTYTVSLAGCPNASADVIVNVTTGADATISAAGPFCADDAALNLTAVDGGGTWTGNGITDGALGTFDPATAGAGTHTITYTISGGCGDTDTEDIVVTAVENASFTYPASQYCTADTDPTPTVTGVGSGNWSIDNGGTIDASGVIDLDASGAGSYIITYTTTGTCPGTETFALDIGVTQDATISAAGPFCLNDASVNLTSVDGGGAWTGTGITDGVLGTFDPATAGAGNHTITYTIAGACGDTDTEDITVQAMDDPTYSYANSTYCTSDTDPIPTVTGLTGGNFTIDNGGTIDISTGEVDLDASGSGSYAITYTTTGSCPSTLVVNMTILQQQDATITAAGPFCEDAAALDLTGAFGGGTWNGTGITDNAVGTFNPGVAGPGTHTITYTITGTCGDVDTEDIVVTALDDATFTYAFNNYCVTETDPTPTITGLAGGTFTIDNGGTIDLNSGVIDLDASGAGTYIITYTTTGTCPNSETFTVLIGTGFDATITPAGPFCENGANSTMVGVDGGGTWTGTGITDGALGTFDPSVAGPGTHTITYTIPGGCGDVDTEDIVVTAADDASFDFGATTFCLGEANPIANITGLAGGIFTINNGGTIDASTGEVDITASGIGSFTVTYTTNGTCPEASSISITITDAVDPSITAVGPFCIYDAADSLQSATSGGTWTGTGITNGTNGMFDPATAGAGTHEIIYTLTGGCASADTIDIVVNDLPIITISSDTTITEGESITLNATGGGTYLWIPSTNLSCSDCDAPVATPSDTTTYCVAVTSTEGCIDTACVVINVDEEETGCEVFVPDGFSPNGDGNNDLECVFGSCVESMNFAIYDRWGEKVFETSTVGECWDGTFRGQAMNTGVYAYVLDFTLVDGTSETRKGNLSLFR